MQMVMRSWVGQEDALRRATLVGEDGEKHTAGSDFCRDCLLRVAGSCRGQDPERRRRYPLYAPAPFQQVVPAWTETADRLRLFP
jgi:hypothetical protein